jgi:hypothetical protein
MLISSDDNDDIRYSPPVPPFPSVEGKENSGQQA